MKNERATPRQLLLAVALVTTELIAGMQSYLTQLILPIMAQDLGAQRLYGLIIGTGAIAQFIALPIGASLLTRFKLPGLLLVLTVGVIVGSVVCAISPNIWIYLLGQIVRAFSGGCMATVTIGAVALGLKGRARRITLAFSSASWVVASIVGPTYAAWATHLFSWRWSMLLYLPFLLIARWVIAVNLKVDRSSQPSPLNFRGAITLGVGLALTIAPLEGTPKLILALIGVVVLCFGAVRVLPEGTFTNRSPRHVALAAMFFLTGAYFAANEVITLTHHDVYGAGEQALGVVILCGGLAWALIGLVCGIRPANGFRSYVQRATVGTLGMSVSFLLIAVTMMLGMPWQAIITLSVLWAAASIGMGMTYLDTLNTVFEEPKIPDGMSLQTVASATVIVEAVASSVFVTLSTTVLGATYSADGNRAASGPYIVIWIALAIVAVMPAFYLHRAKSSSRPSPNKTSTQPDVS